MLDTPLSGGHRGVVVGQAILFSIASICFSLVQAMKTTLVTTPPRRQQGRSSGVERVEVQTERLVACLSLALISLTLEKMVIFDGMKWQVTTAARCIAKAYINPIDRACDDPTLSDISTYNASARGCVLVE